MPSQVALFVAALVLVASPVLAQVDMSGEWARRIHEDQPHRNPGAELGDYTGLPINAAARQKASSWDASILSLPEHMAKPHPAQYFMRGPGPDMRIYKITDPVTQVVTAYTLDRTNEPDGDSRLIVTSIIEDAAYLNVPLMPSTQFKREPDGAKFNPRPCEVTPPVVGAGQ
ncbi:MAG TPA: hypothetical protein VIX63_07485 [Vicinamibacterales bacterium]